jgi:integration host factor subunit alpha
MSEKNRQPQSIGAEACVDAQRGTLTRQDIALAIFERVGGISRREAKRLTDCVINEMVSTLISGENLKLHDFGSFVVREKNERAGCNPRTGAPVPIEARRVVVFRASPNMKATVNGGAQAQRGKPKGAAKRRKDAGARAGEHPSSSKKALDEA